MKVFGFKYWTILISLWCFSVIANAQECPSPKQVPVEDYNPQEVLVCPIIVVDKLGNQEWKRPPQKEVPKPEIIQKKPEFYFIKGENSGYSLEATTALTGYFVGASLGGHYQTNRWSFGGSVRYYNYSSLEGVSSNNILFLGSVNYHFLPRWYTHSPSHKRFDLGLRALVGYSLVQDSAEDETSSLKSSPVIGAGGFISYPLWENLRTVGSVEVFQGVSGFNPMGSAFSLGISYDF